MTPGEFIDYLIEWLDDLDRETPIWSDMDPILTDLGEIISEVPNIKAEAIKQQPVAYSGQWPTAKLHKKESNNGY